MVTDDYMIPVYEMDDYRMEQNLIFSLFSFSEDLKRCKNEM